MGALHEIHDTSLCARVERLIRSHKGERPLLHSASMHTVIAELIARNEGLEKAIRELTREIQDHWTPRTTAS